MNSCLEPGKQAAWNMTSLLVQHFRDLDVYNKAFDISVEIHTQSLQFPKTEQFAMGDQIRRASKSICANIAEGFGKQRGSRKEFKRYLTIAQGSAHEMLVWISYCKELSLITDDMATKWEAEYNSIIRMLGSLHNKIQD